MSKEKDKIVAAIIYFWLIRHTRKKVNLKENATFFHIPICSSLNLDELICTSPVSVRALNRSSARHHYASV